MNALNFNRYFTNKTLFVWEGTERFIGSADELASSFKNAPVHAIYPVPHEHVHTYGAFACFQDEPPRLERPLRRAFEQATRRCDCLRNVKLEILCGDRITEIVRWSGIIKAKTILLPPFEQTAFSKWLHGDLNKRIVAKAPCDVMFLDDTHPDRIEMSDSHPDSSTKDTN